MTWRGAIDNRGKVNVTPIADPARSIRSCAPRRFARKTRTITNPSRPRRPYHPDRERVSCLAHSKECTVWRTRNLDRQRQSRRSQWQYSRRWLRTGPPTTIDNRRRPGCLHYSCRPPDERYRPIPRSLPPRQSMAGPRDDGDGVERYRQSRVRLMNRMETTTTTTNILVSKIRQNNTTPQAPIIII
jgi:hypothetical protein